MQSISMQIETWPTTNQQKQVSKREKEMEVGRHAHTHARTLITKLALSTEGPNK